MLEQQMTFGEDYWKIQLANRSGNGLIYIFALTEWRKQLQQVMQEVFRCTQLRKKINAFRHATVVFHWQRMKLHNLVAILSFSVNIMLVF